MTATDLAGLTNGVTYYFFLNSVEYSITAGTNETYETVSTLINNAVSGDGYESVIVGTAPNQDIRIRDIDRRGTQSKVILDFGVTGTDLFSSLTGFTDLDDPVSGGVAGPEYSRIAAGGLLTAGAADTVLDTGSAGTSFISTWQTNATNALGGWGSGSNQVVLPLYSGGTYNFTVYWGDGNQDTITTSSASHTYGSAGTYDIEIEGQCEGFGFTQAGLGTEDNHKLIGIKQWGDVKLHNLGYQFTLTYNFANYLATDDLDISNITNMNGMFGTSSAANHITTIPSWDTSAVTSMDDMFDDSSMPYGTTIPDPFDLSVWCVPNIPSSPSNFGPFNGTTQIEPIWGTCP